MTPHFHFVECLSIHQISMKRKSKESHPILEITGRGPVIEGLLLETLVDTVSLFFTYCSLHSHKWWNWDQGRWNQLTSVVSSAVGPEIQRAIGQEAHSLPLGSLSGVLSKPHILVMSQRCS